MMVGLSWACEWQYHRSRSESERRLNKWVVRIQREDIPSDFSGRVRSTTMPIVLANLTGLCGVLAWGGGKFNHRLHKRCQITREEEHFSFCNGDVLEHSIVYNSQDHRPFVLVEPLLLEVIDGTFVRKHYTTLTSVSFT